MIKFSGTDKDTGRPFLGMGLSARNIDLLMDSKPIKIDGRPLGMPMDVFIFYATTEADAIDLLREVGVELPKPQPSPPGADNHD
jgi:hypothetical protein